MIKKNIEEITKEIINEFNFFENWEEKYEYIIDIGKKLPIMPNKLKIKDKLIIGCQSKVWLYPYNIKEKIFFYADSDAIIPKGIIGLMLKIYSGQSYEDIIKSNINFLYKIGFSSFLSQTRSNGIELMFNKIKNYAIDFKY